MGNVCSSHPNIVTFCRVFFSSVVAAKAASLSDREAVERLKEIYHQGICPIIDLVWGKERASLGNHIILQLHTTPAPGSKTYSAHLCYLQELMLQYKWQEAICTPIIRPGSNDLMLNETIKQVFFACVTREHQHTIKLDRSYESKDALKTLRICLAAPYFFFFRM